MSIKMIRLKSSAAGIVAIALHNTCTRVYVAEWQEVAVFGEGRRRGLSCLVSTSEGREGGREGGREREKIESFVSVCPRPSALSPSHL